MEGRGPAREALEERRVISPGSARFHIADVPCLQDGSIGGGLGELHGSIAIDLGDRVWSRVPGSFEFPVRVVFDHHFIAGMVGVVPPFGVFLLLF